MNTNKFAKIGGVGLVFSLTVALLMLIWWGNELPMVYIKSAMTSTIGFLLCFAFGASKE